MWEALELGDQPVPGEQDRTRHYQDKIDAARATDGDADPRTRLFFTPAWSAGPWPCLSSVA
ncbi:hypothetical protein ACFWA9_21735 [Kitasatospora sp. NPDC059973]|uniref:hypothetical protein n=1 Tax=Kitasatospora sp. NPDC059973 TaxID=3347020 RepID=UPI00367BAB4F